MGCCSGETQLRFLHEMSDCQYPFLLRVGEYAENLPLERVQSGSLWQGYQGQFSFPQPLHRTRPVVEVPTSLPSQSLRELSAPFPSPLQPLDLELGFGTVPPMPLDRGD